MRLQRACEKNRTSVQPGTVDFPAQRPMPQMVTGSGGKREEFHLSRRVFEPGWKGSPKPSTRRRQEDRFSERVPDMLGSAEEAGATGGCCPGPPVLPCPVVQLLAASSGLKRMRRHGRSPPTPAFSRPSHVETPPASVDVQLVESLSFFGDPKKAHKEVEVSSCNGEGAVVRSPAAYRMSKHVAGAD